MTRVADVHTTDVLIAHQAVIRALEVIGARILGNRRLRGQYRDTPRHLIYTQVRVTPAEMGHVMGDALWSTLEHALPEYAPCMVPALDIYLRDLLVSGVEHQRDYLYPVLAARGYTECRTAGR